MKNILMVFLAIVVVVGFSAPIAMAQMAPTPPPKPAPPAAAPMTPSPLPPQEKTIDGPVKGVDPIEKTVKVGWFMGLFSTTLHVDDNTQIAAQGSKLSLVGIREGDRVKASYESRDGDNVAKSINVEPNR